MKTQVGYVLKLNMYSLLNKCRKNEKTEINLVKIVFIVFYTI